MSPDSSLVVANTDGSEYKNFIFFIDVLYMFLPKSVRG